MKDKINTRFRLIELDTHHNNKNNSHGNDNAGNGHVQYKDFKLVQTTSSEVVSEKHGNDKSILLIHFVFSLFIFSDLK